MNLKLFWIGMKYGTLQIKLAVVGLLMNFRLTPETRTEGSKVAAIPDLIQKPSDDEQIIFECL